MMMLSELLRHRVIDGEGRSLPLADLSYPAVGDDYPRVTKLFVNNGEQRALPWSAVERIDRKARRIHVKSLDAFAAGDGEDEAVDVLLGRDVLDALVIDLLNRTTTRATDLSLDEENGELWVRAVDSGFGAMLRRISRGWYSHVGEHTLSDWKYVEYLRGDPKTAKGGSGYRMRIVRLTAGEIAQLTDYIPYLHATELLTILPDDKAAAVLELMKIERQVQVIEEYDEDQATELIRRMSPDLAADLLARLDLAYMRKQLQRLPRIQSERIVELLKYPENSVGGMMVNDVICFESEKTVAEARKLLPGRLKDSHFVATIFVIDNEADKKLAGVLSLRELLVAPEDRTLQQVMYPYLQFLDPFDEAREAAWKIVSTQLYAMPVVDEGGKLLGAMTVDAATSQLLSGQLQGLRIFS